MKFTDEEMAILAKSPYIEKVYKHQILYGKLFSQEYWRIKQLGYTSEEAFDFLGLNPKILGKQRIVNFDLRVRKLVEENELYEVGSDGTVPISQQLRQKDNEIKRLRQEVDFLKKKKMLDWKYKK